MGTVNQQIGARVITLLAAHSDDVTHPLLRIMACYRYMPAYGGCRSTGVQLEISWIVGLGQVGMAESVRIL